MERNVVNKKTPQKQKQYTVKINVTTVKQQERNGGGNKKKKKNNSLRIKVS